MFARPWQLKPQRISEKNPGGMHDPRGSIEEECQAVNLPAEANLSVFRWGSFVPPADLRARRPALCLTEALFLAEVGASFMQWH